MVLNSTESFKDVKEMFEDSIKKSLQDSVSPIRMTQCNSSLGSTTSLASVGSKDSKSSKTEKRQPIKENQIAKKGFGIEAVKICDVPHQKDDTVKKVRNRPVSCLSFDLVDELEKCWCFTASKCDFEKLKKLYAQDHTLINKKDYFTGAAIHWAAKQGRDDIIRWLYHHHADTNIRTGGYTPLHIATMQGNETVIRNLLQYYEGDINVRDYSGRKPRHYLQPVSSIAIQRALQATPSVLDMHVTPSTMSLPYVTLTSSVSTLSLNRENTLENLRDNEPVEHNNHKKKKRTLSITQSFKKGRKAFIEKKHGTSEHKIPDSPSTSPRRQHSKSSPEITLVHSHNESLVDDPNNKSLLDTSVLPYEKILHKKNSSSEHIINGYAGFININKYHRKLPQIPSDTDVAEQPWGINTWV